MKKFIIALAATGATAAALAAPSPAAASCHEVIEGTGCIENAICGAAGKVFQYSPIGRDSVHCIQ